MSSWRRDSVRARGLLLICGGRAVGWTAILAVCLSWHAGTALVHADALRIGQYWKKGITFDSVEGGTLIYTDSGGDEREVRLAEITALDASGYPFLREAHAAMDEGDDAAALRQLATDGQGVRHPWLKQWIAWHLMQCHARRGATKEAVAAYLDLVRQRSDDFYLGQPPAHLLDGVDEVTKRDLHARLTSALGRAAGSGKTGLETLLASLGPLDVAPMDDAAPPAPVRHANPAPAPSPTRPPGNQASGQRLGDGASAAELPSFIPVDDPVTQRLRDGKFEEAVKRVDGLLARADARHVSMRWYQRGVARRALAERMDAETGSGAAARELALQAGVDFMRVVVYFPSGRYRGPSLVEAADVHLRLGRHAMARRLLEEAQRPPKAIGAKETPRYHRRLMQLSDRISAAR